MLKERIEIIDGGRLKDIKKFVGQIFWESRMAGCILQVGKSFDSATDQTDNLKDVFAGKIRDF
jgi:hypothetical protein